ncbi:unknown [Anaerotruncus sp. CAG:390]|nr:unknown [Anaerotruncus sp. CAG:390]
MTPIRDFFKIIFRLSLPFGRQKRFLCLGGLSIRYALGIHIHLRTEPDKVNLFERPGRQGIKQMRPLMDDIISDYRRQNAYVLTYSF